MKDVNKFILGDCMDPDTGLPSYPDNYFDVIITDPPWGIDYQSSRKTDKSKRLKKIQNDKSPYTVWIKEAFRVLNDGGRLLFFYRWDVRSEFIDEVSNTGFNIIGEIVWDKIVHGMGDLNCGIAPQHETILYSTKGKYEFEKSRPKSVYRTGRVYADNLIHPNEKPPAIWQALLEDFATIGEIILDPFAGSASSLIACESMGFNYVGYEIDNDYYEAANKRMAKGIQKRIW